MYGEQNRFEKALAYFGTRVEVACAMEMGGKLSSQEAFKIIKEAYKELKKIKKVIKTSKK